MPEPFSAWLVEAFVARLRRRVVDAPVRFVLWDGRTVDLGDGPPVAHVHVRTRRAWLGILWDPASYFGEAYARGDVHVEGDLCRALEAVYRGWKAAPPRPWPRAFSHTIRRSRDNARHHYDIGNDFYRAWLDPEMVYTCAYFPHAGCSLEDAQRAKLEYVCRKLRLARGESVLEAGCGWGALAMYMARRCGVQVTACNVSREQIDWARRRARERGLEGAVTFIEDDYRNVRGRYQAFVSVGMLEHVGRERYSDLGRRLDGWLDSRRGRGLLHFIGRNRPGALNPWIEKRIFPGAYPPVLSEVEVEVLEPWDFETEDVENLRAHYARTVAHWRARFEAAWPSLEPRYGRELLRAWRLYLAGSEVAFTTGYLQLFQIVFSRSASTALRTRDALYREPFPAAVPRETPDAALV